jgi:hypothetical protein
MCNASAKCLTLYKDTLGVSFSPRHTACSGTYVTLNKRLYYNVHAEIMYLDDQNNVSRGYFL